MRLILILGALVALLAVGCGDGDSSVDVPSELEDVCEQTDEADTEHIDVSSPEPGDEIQSPLRVTGKIDAIGGEFWIAAVKGDGTHVIDYPARSSEFVEGEMSEFDVTVPFSVGEETPTCVWVYRVNVPSPDDAIRIPVTFQPTTEASE